jgi:pimeloyl-ACP methyl ester carboxylesterase
MVQALNLQVQDLNIAVTRAGDTKSPALLLLHGWPQARGLYDGVMDALAADFHVLAPDLPNIGESRGAPSPAEKTILADIVLAAAEKAGAHHITIAGLDVGGMIAFAAARDHGERIKGAVVMNTVIPGLDPWRALLADPRVWHFALHNTPNLPETLVAGRQSIYFDFFHDYLSADPKRISRELRDQFAAAYARPEALKAGFDWYRAMEADAKRNAISRRIETPVLYVRGLSERGDREARDIEPYLEGLRSAGVERVQCRVVKDCGELIPIEQPSAFVEIIRSFAQEVAH